MSADEAIDLAARTEHLLVASDFDGTLAPIVEGPALAAPDPHALRNLVALGGLPRTHGTILSGRARADLRERIGEVGPLVLVGSHGAEIDQPVILPTDTAALLDRVKEEVRRIAGRFSGALVEEKPASVAFHYRQVSESEQARAAAAVLEGPGSRKGVRPRQGKKFVELMVVEADKGTALRHLRERLGATGVVYLGDDVTDEDAFAILGPEDVGVKIGPGESRARYRLGAQPDVAPWLAELLARRRAAVAQA